MDEGSVRHRERRYGRFTRSFRLPEDAEATTSLPMPVTESYRSRLANVRSPRAKYRRSYRVLTGLASGNRRSLGRALTLPGGGTLFPDLTVGAGAPERVNYAARFWVHAGSLTVFRWFNQVWEGH
ncbi:MAG: hypothetical protein Ct9H300mP8_02180 [Gammaproteobacteria bacterium]|nr:MAG: hypothetical protein Ct9H300mP8_02180 [Gammaproteobacteria bacterium]